MERKPKWRVIVCERCALPVEAVLTASPYIPVVGLNIVAEDHRQEFGHWPAVRIADAASELEA